MAVLAGEDFQGCTIGAAITEAQVIFSNVDNVGITCVAGLNGTTKACNIAPATTGACRDTFNPAPTRVARFMFKFSSLPIADTVIAHMCLGDPNLGGLRVIHLYLTTTGKLVMRNVFTVVGTSTMTFAAGTEYALEWMFDGANQQQSLRMFTNLTLTATAAETLGPVGATAAAEVDWIQVGKMTNTTWTGGITIDNYKRANDWVAAPTAAAAIWNEEWVGTDGSDISVPASWAKEGSNTNSPKYKTGGPHTDQSYLNFGVNTVGNRNLLSLQMPAGLAAYERFYGMLNLKPALPEEHETIWSAGSLGGIILFRLVASGGTNKTYDLELWADDDWNPTAPDPGVGDPPLPLPLGVIEDLAIDTFHRVEIFVNATSGPAMCTVNVWEDGRRNEPALPDQTVSGSCVGTTLLRYRRYGQMLHSSASNSTSHKGVAFDSIQLAQNGTAIGPLPEAQQFNPPLSDKWTFWEWTGTEEIPLNLAGASTGGATLEEVGIGGGIVTPPPPTPPPPTPPPPTPPPPPPGGLFTNDPGLGSKMYISTDAKATSDRYNLISDLYNFELRTLSAGAGHPASNRCAPGCYRGFYPSPTPGIGWGSHNDTSWSIHRKVAANTAISSWSFDTGYGGSKQEGADDVVKWWDGTRDLYLRNTWAPWLTEAYNRYGHLTILDLGNEADRGDRTNCGLNPLWIHRIKRAVRYIHFFLIDQCDVPPEAFMISMANTVQMTAYDHGDEGGKRHYKPINTTDLSWPSGVRGDALYYWYADWKETRTTAGNYWSDPYDPNPVDFIQPGELDQWSYGRGPTTRINPMNFYERDYEYANIETVAEFRGKLPSLTGGYPRTGNMWKFNKALFGGATPVLQVPTANVNGIPVFIGEYGCGVWVPLPSSSNPADPKETADTYCTIFAKDLVEKCNVVAYTTWRYVEPNYDGSVVDEIDTFNRHWKVGNGSGAGSHVYDPTNANTKAEASLFNTAYVANPPPWPNGTQRPPHIKNTADTKRDRRGIADVVNVT